MVAVPSRNRGSLSTEYFLVALFVFSVVTMFMNSRHDDGLGDSLQVFQNQHFSVDSLTSQESKAKQGRRDLKENAKRKLSDTQLKEKEATGEENQNQEKKSHEGLGRDEKSPDKPVIEQQVKIDVVEKQEHKLAGLDCARFGGPSNDLAAEMVYWSDIPSDNYHVSPFYDSNKYMTFEPDQGGWNNIRMSMETVLAMAVAAGRTLVLPPVQRMYLLDTGEHHQTRGKQRRHFSFNDFYHLESISVEHGLGIITMKQFLEEHAITGKLKDSNGMVVFPPGNRTDWDGHDVGEDKQLKRYLRTVSLWPQWNPDTCMASFPASKDPKDLQALTELKTKIETEWDERYKSWNAYQMYVGKPTPVDAPMEERAKENWAIRKTLCIYDREMQQAPLIHFGYDDGGEGARLLVHFYAFLFFQDWKQDLWIKRFIRDHVRYVDEIQCAAARVVNAVRERARKRNPASDGEYDAFHIRRGDFQYTDTRIDADKIYEASKDALTPNSTIYIGTDERDRSFFKPLADHYDLVFLDDFKDLVKDVNSNFYGMLDQLITSRGRVFFGCYYSSFTGHTTRIRGYHSVKSKLPGYQEGTLPSTFYYATESERLHLQTFYPVKKTFWEREYPASWRDIDKSIVEMGIVS